MLELKDFMPVNFLKKEKFTGSYQGMRFRMEKADGTEEGDAPSLLVTAWPEPYNYDSTPEEEKQSCFFSFDADGIAAGVDWLNGQFAAKKELWKSRRQQTGI